MAVYNWYCGPDKTGKTCKVLIFLHPHTHHKRSSASNLWCPIPGWQQWWQGQLQSHNLLSSTYGRRAESWKASSSTSNCCCYCCCCCCCWGSRWRGDNHQYCYRASDKLQQVVVAQRSRLIIIQRLRFLSEILRRKADSAATLVAGAAADDYELGLAQDCLSCQYIEFYTLFKSYKRIDRYDVSVCYLTHFCTLHKQH